MQNCRYYIFQHEPGKRWKIVDGKINQGAFERDEADPYAYYVKLAWDTSKEIKFRSDGCRL